MFSPSTSERVVHPPRARRTDRELVRRRLGRGESPITIRGGQFAGAICKLAIAHPKIDTANSLTPVEYRSRSFLGSKQRSVVRCLWSVVWRRKSGSAFTLLELIIVVGIIGLLLVLVAPAYTTIKGGTDVTSAAYTIKGALDTARTYAKANNTYTWVGFYEEDASQSSVIPAPDPRCTGCVGRVVISIVASKDGTNLGADASSSAAGTENFIDATKLVQVNKLIKLDNVHLPLFALGTGTGDTFDARPSPTPATDAPLSRFGELNALPPNTAPYDPANAGITKFPFQYPVGSPVPAWQYRFRRTLRFSPTGECRINSTYDARKVVEAGLLQTHGSATPPPRSGGGTQAVTWDGNVAAVQISGIGGNVKIYRR